MGGEWEGEVEEGEVDEDEKLSMMCWNVCGWSRNGGVCGNGVKDVHDMRAEVIGFYRPDVVALVETWLKGEDEISFEGYKRFGNNKRHLNKRAVRGSGGFGVVLTVHKLLCGLFEGSRSGGGV